VVAAEESKLTVLVAFAANLVIAVAKLVAGMLSGSAAMLAEGAHSVADTTNQVFLLTALRRGKRPADETHPFGYGKERFFWSLLAAVGIFVSGAVFSVYQGVHGLLSGSTESEGRYGVSYLVLAIAFVAEGVSWMRAVAQVRAEAQAAGREFSGHIRASSDPTVKTVISEDSAALVGLLLAAAGLGLHQITGSPVWDNAAAIAIGLLLALVAFLLGWDTKELLIGESADPKLLRALKEALSDYDEVVEVLELLTMYLGPEQLLVAARVDFRDDLGAAEVEQGSSQIAQDLRRRFPEVKEVFLDATPASDPYRSVRLTSGRPAAGSSGRRQHAGGEQNK